jgi:hypothetical protein
MATQLAKELEQNGIVVIPNSLTKEQLRGMQKAFALRLGRLRWNRADGYEKTEPYRDMVEDVLTLHQGFLDAALHPVIKETLHEYLGPELELVEAKGWRSLPTRRDFHGWHSDAWYDQEVVQDIPREVKLGIYLTDVRSGAFNYIKRSHGQEAPRGYANREVAEVPRDQILEVIGPAGLAFLFDTTGIHRQGVPILEPRHAVFYNYHNPRVPLQKEDIAGYRYHPLLLNAAFLGNLSEEDRRILGFGNKTNYIEGFERSGQHPGFQTLMRVIFTAKVHVDDFRGRVTARLRRVLKMRSRYAEENKGENKGDADIFLHARGVTGVF